jgi:pilus assembly protein TadC
MGLIKYIANSIPHLEEKLSQAEIQKTKEAFVRDMLKMSLYATIALFFIFMGFKSLFKIEMLHIILVCLALYFFIFLYMTKSPDIYIIKINKEINREVIFAGRFLIVELESGISVYKALKTCAKNYKIIGKYMQEIVNKVDFGTSIEVALAEAVTKTASPNFRKVLWQLLNSLKTGADVSRSLNSVIDQITTEQTIEVKEYGRKLNPLAMFYMISAIILPSIGIIMLIVFTSFMGIKMNLTTLLAVSGLIAFVQFMFFNVIKAQRPAVEL